eukprot:3424625-Amphidinium_carterae.1
MQYARGLAVEMVSELLEALPTLPNVTKVAIQSRSKYTKPCTNVHSQRLKKRLVRQAPKFHK